MVGDLRRLGTCKVRRDRLRDGRWPAAGRQSLRLQQSDNLYNNISETSDG